MIGKKHNFVTINELVSWTNEWVKTFPTTYDIIVGIPKSGLLVANIIASKLDKPFTTPDLFVQGLDWEGKDIENKNEFKNVLLVDDSIDRGYQLEKNFQTISSHHPNLDITKAVLFPNKNSKDKVDLFYKIVPQPRVFEWDFIHTKKWALVAIAGFVLMVAKLWKPLLSLDWYWYALIFVLAEFYGKFVRARRIFF